MKFITSFFILFIFISSASAVTMTIDQDKNLFDLENALTGNHILQFVASNVDETISVDNATQTYTYDYKLEISDASENFYLGIENFYDNSTYYVQFRGDTTKDSTLYVQELTLNEQGQYFFKFEPSYDGEPVVIYIDLVASGGAGVFNVAYLEEKPKGFNNLIGGFVDTFSQVFDINVKLWYLLYYLIIIILTIGFISIIFGIATFLFGKAKEIRKGESFFDMSHDKSRDSKERRNKGEE